jgi:four helix bundle protein
MARQLVAAATAVHANYRAACRARTRAEFIAKSGIVLEEADECCGWLELMVTNSLVSLERAAPARAEAEELTAIFAASLKTARRRSPPR